MPNRFLRRLPGGASLESTPSGSMMGSTFLPDQYWRCQLFGWGGLGLIWLGGALFGPTFRLRDCLWSSAFSACGLVASHVIKLRLSRLDVTE